MEPRSEQTPEPDDEDEQEGEAPETVRALDAGKQPDARALDTGAARPGSSTVTPAADAAGLAAPDTGSRAQDDAGSPPPEFEVPSECPRELLGWASVAGDQVQTTTGGGNASPVRPKNADELLAYASDETPRVIEIAGSFSVPRLQVNSNKTLLGIGKDATLRGGIRIRGSKSEPVSNVILRNLRVDGATTIVDNDAVQLQFAHHVWVDHCEIWDGPDGSLDMTHAVNWVTVSWTKVRYSENYKRPEGESSDHRFASLLGHSDNNAGEDTGRLKVSFHHNWWGERVIERMPRVRFGQVHVFNNYFASPDNNYCVRAGVGARLLIEGNFFDHVNSPHEFNSAEDEPTAHITARDNQYEGCQGTQATGGGGMPFTSVPYTARIEPAASIPALVKACAGPR